jgi:thioredoxin 1
MITEINDQNFNSEVLNAKGPILIDFYADWCRPCQTFLPTVNEVSEELADSLKVVKVNIDNSPQTAEALGVRGIPALFLYQDGKQVAATTGSRPKSQLIDWVQDAIV